MFNRSLWTPLNGSQNSTSLKKEFDCSILMEFGPHSNSKCFTEEKRAEYIDKLLSTDISRELPKPLRGFCLGDANNHWDQGEWRFKANTSEKVHLWTKKTFSSSAKNLGVIRRIVVLEEFFDLIKSHHERPNKDGYNGQKKLFNLIKNRYACLPRDAVDKYITMWRKATSQVPPAEECITREESTTLKIVSDDRIPKVASVTLAAAATATERTMVTSAAFSVEDRRKNYPMDSAGVNVSLVESINKFSGISMVYQPQVTSELKLATHSPLLNIKYQIDNGENQLANLLSGTHFLKQDSDSSNHDSSKENSFENDDLVPSKRMKFDDGDSDTNTDNDGTIDDNISHINGDQTLKIHGMKRPSDVDMAYNIFVRRIIDDTLDRTVTFCEQPKCTILGLENVCAEAFPLFDSSRHRNKIRGYLKACRRNSKKHNGKISMKDTPSHLCSDKAYSLANEAFLQVGEELQRLKSLRPGDAEVNQLNISKPAETEGSNTDANCSEYMDFVMSSNNLDPCNPVTSAQRWPQLSSSTALLPSFLPSLYGMIPLPALLSPVGVPSCGDVLCPAPPPAHANQYFNSLPGSLFSVMDGCSHYDATSHLLEKMLQCSSIDPDFGMELVINRCASQEAINYMRVTARYLLSRSVMMESYLMKETSYSDCIVSNDR